MSKEAFLRVEPSSFSIFSREALAADLELAVVAVLLRDAQTLFHHN